MLHPGNSILTTFPTYVNTPKTTLYAPNEAATIFLTQFPAAARVEDAHERPNFEARERVSNTRPADIDRHRPLSLLAPIFALLVIPKEGHIQLAVVPGSALAWRAMVHDG